MLGTKIYKENFDSELYAKCAEYCNVNNKHIADKGEYYEVEEYKYDLTEEKNQKLNVLYRNYKTELANTLDPTELQVRGMMLSDTDEPIDIIGTDGAPVQYMQDELTELLNSELQKRNELLLKYKTLYNKVKNAKKVETVHGVKW